MKPELQKIFTKLSEEKLERVELSIMTDIEKLYDKGLADNKRIRTQIEKLARDYNEASKSFSDMLMKINRAEKLADELGDKEMIRYLQNRKQEAKYYIDEMTGRAQKIISALP